MQKPFEEMIKLRDRLKNSENVSKFSAKNPYRGDDYMNFYNLGDKLKNF